MFKKASLLLVMLSAYAGAQDRFANVKIEPTQLSGSAYMLVGSGGNIGVSAGEDGLLIIDDQFEPLAEKIGSTLKDINEKPVSYIINTHYHGDHTGGNAWFKDNQGATVFAHDNVRIRMALNAEANPSSLPVVTYEKGLRFHFNGDTLTVTHLASGHTDGDSVIFFEKANVLHAGDQLFNGLFPYIDLSSGGSVKGYIENVGKILEMINDNTQVIPGHGPLATKADIEKYLLMLRSTSSAVAGMKYQQGKTLAEAIEQGLGDTWKDWSWQFINEERWITTLYNGL